ncbi:hypothetical protein ACIRG5_08990 [Lentzea sp. NPDC102401]|uniref:hypothetical protein n=1 Tax=Lentzea sp. NPDC102401 TaxID=3364128 RepID=UPI0037F9BA93
MKLRVLAGDPADPGMGAEVEVAAGAGPRSGLAVPYLRLVGRHGSREILVGEARVTATRVEIAVSATWTETGGWHREPWNGEALGETLTHPAHPIRPNQRDVSIAKGIAEGSRNTVGELRQLRYEMERQVADLLTQRTNAKLRLIMAQLVELSIAFSRARDFAREAIREQLWMRDGGALPHCQAMDTELGDEMTRLQSLLGSVSTLAVAQDGEAQQRFNTLAAAAAAGLGLPALILSLYGADEYLPFTWDKAWRALTPIAGVLTVAAGIILSRMPGRTTGKHHLVAAGLITGLIAVLLIAGFLAPG